jgi:hypothetical protein
MTGVRLSPVIHPPARAGSPYGRASRTDKGHLGLGVRREHPRTSFIGPPQSSQRIGIKGREDGDIISLLAAQQLPLDLMQRQLHEILVELVLTALRSADE